MTRRLELLAEEAATCTACRLSDTRTSVVFGAGDPDASLFIIGEGPGANEDLSGVPFVGRSGELLDRLLREVLDLGRDQVFIANIVKCRPPDNRDPKPDEIASCSGFLSGQIAAVSPMVIVTLGNVATRAVVGTREGITTLRGTLQTTALCSVPVVPTFHPAAGLRGGPQVVATMAEDLALVGGLIGVGLR
jgi:DNA polymerase